MLTSISTYPVTLWLCLLVFPKVTLSPLKPETPYLHDLTGWHYHYYFPNGNKIIQRTSNSQNFTNQAINYNACFHTRNQTTKLIKVCKLKLQGYVYFEGRKQEQDCLFLHLVCYKQKKKKKKIHPFLTQTQFKILLMLLLNSLSHWSHLQLSCHQLLVK